MKDLMGDRFKRYEHTTKTLLNRRSYTIIRIDGKAFHTYTKGLMRPFDEGFMHDMDATAVYLCENIQGAKVAYTQSDEISILLTDFDTLGSQAWFDGEIQKVVSIASSLATAKFNQARMSRWLIENKNTQYERESAELIPHFKLAHFDARVFQLPTQTEVINYFLWRQKDCVRNSISTVAQTFFSAKELNGKSSQAKIEMLLERKVDWAGLPDKYKYGRNVVKESYQKLSILNEGEFINRTRWVSMEAKPFNMHHFLFDRIPQNI